MTFKVKNMIILGIDPGSQRTGFGVIKIKDNNVIYINSGVIKTLNKQIGINLKNIQFELNKVVNEYNPTESAIEKIFVLQKNPKSALTLGEARGVALYTLAINNLSIYEYSTKTIKKSVVGYGNATKNQIQNMVQRKFKLKTLPQADEADALATAMCHYNSII